MSVQAVVTTLRKFSNTEALKLLFCFCYVITIGVRTQERKRKKELRNCVFYVLFAEDNQKSRVDEDHGQA